jgi:hypothetical protein
MTGQDELAEPDARMFAQLDRIAKQLKATLVFFTDGLVEHHKYALDERLAVLARLATQHASRSPKRLCQALLDNHPGDGSDDIAILTLRLPPHRSQ